MARNLKKYLSERAECAHGGEPKPSSRFREAAAIWFAGVERARRGSTVDNYRQRPCRRLTSVAGLLDVSGGRVDPLLVVEDAPAQRVSRGAGGLG
jgi:hypothetical protein